MWAIFCFRGTTPSLHLDWISTGASTEGNCFDIVSTPKASRIPGRKRTATHFGWDLSLIRHPDTLLALSRTLLNCVSLAGSAIKQAAFEGIERRLKTAAIGVEVFSCRIRIE